MERSSSNRAGGPGLGARLDRAALGGIAAGLALYVAPFWSDGRLRWAFWLTGLSTILHVFTSRRASGPGPRDGRDP